MNIKSATHEVVVDVDGEPVYVADTYATTAPVNFRPTSVTVKIRSDWSAGVEVRGYKQTKAGRDFKDPMTISYWGWGRHRESWPAYVAEAVAAAKAFVKAGS
jgi:FlaG/FlaF family flagellin (archaellin)